MLFLMNDLVLNLEPEDIAPKETVKRFFNLSLTYVAELAGELFAEHPTLHVDFPERAKRLAGLVIAKDSEINAMRIHPLRDGCKPSEVGVHYAKVAFEIMAILYQRQQSVGASSEEVDRQVWQRLSVRSQHHQPEVSFAALAAAI